MGIGRVGSLIVVLAALAGCSPSGPWGHFDIPFEEARARLMKADIIGFRDARQCGYLIHLALNTPDPRTVGWVVTNQDVIVAKFFVKLTPSGSGVDADFDIPKGPNGFEIYDGKQTYDYPVLLQPLRPALRELVDSAMAQRKFEWERIPREQPSIDPKTSVFGNVNDAPVSQTQSYCFAGRQTLEHGVAWSMDDPPGFPPRGSIYRP